MHVPNDVGSRNLCKSKYCSGHYTHTVHRDSEIIQIKLILSCSCLNRSLCVCFRLAYVLISVQKKKQKQTYGKKALFRYNWNNIRLRNAILNCFKHNISRGHLLKKLNESLKIQRQKTSFYVLFFNSKLIVLEKA